MVGSWTLVNIGASNVEAQYQVTRWPKVARRPPTQPPLLLMAKQPIDTIATRVLQSLLQSVTSLQPGRGGGGYQRLLQAVLAQHPKPKVAQARKLQQTGHRVSPPKFITVATPPVGRNLKYSTKYNPRISRLQPYPENA